VNSPSHYLTRYYPEKVRTGGQQLVKYQLVWQPGRILVKKKKNPNTITLSWLETLCGSSVNPYITTKVVNNQMIGRSSSTSVISQPWTKLAPSFTHTYTHTLLLAHRGSHITHHSRKLSVTSDSCFVTWTIDVKMVVFRFAQVAWRFQTTIRFPAVKQGLILE
jgi:hypothetical protein